MKKLLLSLIMIGALLPLYAQNGNITGKIYDEAQNPMEFVNVLLLNAADSSLVLGAVTDSLGIYNMDEVSNGKYVISATMVGFTDSYSDVFEVRDEKTEIPELILTSGIELSEVTVKATKPFIEMQADKIVVNVENSSVNAGNSALEVLQKSPGVTVDKDNNISLRGKQGVLIMINGKNQYMSGEEIARLLETMPAANINSIEIIANPSAKYDAEGNSGIINIRLKKNEKLGINGRANAGIRQGKKTTYNTGLSLNYRSDKVNIYGRGSMYNWRGYQELKLDRVIPFEGGVTTFDQLTDMNYKGVSYDFKVGMDYFVTDKTTVGILAKLNTGNDINDHDNMTNISGDSAPAYSLLNVLSTDDEDWDHYSYNFNVKHDFDDKGTELTLDVDYSTYDNPGMNSYENLYKNDAGQQVLDPYMLRNTQATKIDIFAGKVDFTKSLSNGINLELGGKLSMVETDNDTKFEAQENGSWVNQENRSNNFIYKEDVMAGYINASKAIGPFRVQAGLRMEHTMSEGNSVTLDEVVTREYTDFFPSVSLSHMVNGKHSLSYTYSRRLNRPNYRDLNPFVEYLDEYTFQKGNPFLDPQYTDAFGINYGYGNSLFISANYSHTKDAITEVIEQFSESNTTFQTNQNIDDHESASLTISAPRVWSESWTSRLSITSFYNNFKSVIPSGTLDNTSVAYNVYLSNEIQLPASWNMELSGNYTSNMIYGLFEIEPQYGVDMGFSKRIMEGNGSLRIGIDDIFKTRVNKITVLQDDIDLKVINKRDSRRVKVSFSYRFGNKKVQAARNRKTATEDETSRISKGNG